MERRCKVYSISNSNSGTIGLSECLVEKQFHTNSFRETGNKGIPSVWLTVLLGKSWGANLLKIVISSSHCTDTKDIKKIYISAFKEEVQEHLGVCYMFDSITKWTPRPFLSGTKSNFNTFFLTTILTWLQYITRAHLLESFKKTSAVRKLYSAHF